jgi:hypothetical protein
MQAPERHSTRSAEVTKAEAAARLPFMHALILSATLSAGEGGGGRCAARGRSQRGRDRGGHGRGRGGAPAGVAAEPGAGAPAPPPGLPAPLTLPACRRGAQRAHLTWVASAPANCTSTTCRSKHYGDSALRPWLPVSGTPMAWSGASISMSLHAQALLRCLHQHPGPSALDPKNPPQHFEAVHHTYA